LENRECLARMADFDLMPLRTKLRKEADWPIIAGYGVYNYTSFYFGFRVLDTLGLMTSCEFHHLKRIS
jgi:hypothetical protein